MNVPAGIPAEGLIRKKTFLHTNFSDDIYKATPYMTRHFGTLKQKQRFTVFLYIIKKLNPVRRGSKKIKHLQK